MSVHCYPHFSHALPKLLVCPSPKFMISSLIIIYTYYARTYCNLLNPFSLANMYAHVYRINHLVLGILCGSLSLKETNSPSLRSHWLPALHPREGPHTISLSYWHVNWCHNYIDLIQETMLLDFMGTFPLLYLGQTIQQQIFLVSGSYSLYATLPPRRTQTIPTFR